MTDWSFIGLSEQIEKKKYSLSGPFWPWFELLSDAIASTLIWFYLFGAPVS